MRILLTGSEGLIGQELKPLLVAAGYEVCCLDQRLDAWQHGSLDITESHRLPPLLEGCSGIIHLAAVSRVIWGERDPERCRAVNVEATAKLINAAQSAEQKPWMIFSSSREVYGQQDHLPVSEEARLKPMNVYAYSKVAGERLLRRSGLRGAIVRLSNVFGRADDYPDRVIPAFCRAAIEGFPMRLDGEANTFDFTYAPDVAQGIFSLAERLDGGLQPPPPIHFTSGRGITLGEAARIIQEVVGSRAPIVEAPARDFDVATFIGDNSRARQLLGWTPTHSFEEAIEAFVEKLVVLA